MRPRASHPDQLELLVAIRRIGSDLDETSQVEQVSIDGDDAFLQSAEHVSRAVAALEPTRQKALGAFYTPVELAEFLVRWAVVEGARSVLDPACGDGVFLAASRNRLSSLGTRDASIIGVDMDAGAIAAAHSAVRDGRVRGSDSRLIRSDFFALLDARQVGEAATTVDAVVGNPPYVRYQLIDADVRDRALVRAEQVGVRLTQLSSLWAPFVAHGAKWLGPGGRLAFVLPAELLHAQYARPIREFLVSAFRSVTVVTFEERVFPGALTEVVLLLAEKGPPSVDSIRVLPLRSVDDLTRAGDIAERAVRRKAGPHDWSALLAPKAASLLEEITAAGGFAPLGSIAKVDIGTVTGKNEFFTLTEEELRNAKLPRRAVVPVVGKARDILGACHSKADRAQASAAGRKVYLLALPDDVAEGALAPAVRAYLARGKRTGVPRGYKCRTRRRWFSVPATGVPTAFLTYMANDAPRLVMNEAGAWSTNTVHGLSGDPDALRWAAATFINTATLVSVELAGRSYGGGVLKLEPTEAERILVPTGSTKDSVVRARLARADELLRAGEVERLREENDDILWSGKSAARLAAIGHLYRHLRDRRRRRGERPLPAPRA